jgi:endonuclease/exonuclease/phosphatase family metal-dependent hydrolase
MLKSFVVGCVLTLFAVGAYPQVVGDTVRLQSDNAQGVPVHPAAGDASYVRWVIGTIGKIVDEDTATRWLKVEAAGKSGWITKRYLVVVSDEPDGDDSESAENELLTYAIGCWNLEWFHLNHERGFPENKPSAGGPTYQSRKTEDYQRIADIITQRLRARLLVLNEINGQAGNKSAELDKLLTHLGNSWAYFIGNSGGNQRVAMLYDTVAVKKEKIQEVAIPKEASDGSDIFFRDPLVGRFTFLDKEKHPQNDVVVVGIHLASGQSKVSNHNKAMQVLRTKLHSLFDNGQFPAGEKDILIMGDFNASRYDSSAENFWTGYDSTRFKFAALCPEDGLLYPGTRLANVPLHPKSQIDYIFGSTVSGGVSSELVQLIAQVHTQLTAPGGFDDFRQHVSDHLPVTVNIRVVSDDD